jgi:bifunctional UDP-N-acetylglucosamine pyrophosphorylase/glucosamine-1-phosphate N-acetyltransferase
MQGVILAAGKGTRLKPVTLTRTKAMAPILGKPIVERIMEDLAVNGIKDFVLVVSPDDEEIVRHFQEESGLEAAVKFVPQPTRLGMADALKYAIPYIQGDFVLSACDNLMAAQDVRDMVSAWKNSEKIDGLLMLKKIPPEEIPSAGIVEMEGERIKRIVEKPSVEEAPSNIASLPLYCFSHRLLEYIPRVPRSRRGEYELQDAIQMLIDGGGNVRGLTVENRLSLTSPVDLLEINIHYLAQGNGYFKTEAVVAGRNTQFIKPYMIDPGVEIGENCIIGPNAYIERDSQIGNGVVIRDAIVLRQSRITDGSVIEGEVVFRD